MGGVVGPKRVGWGGARSLRSAATKPNTFVVVQFPRTWWFDLRSLGFAALNANLPNANLPNANLPSAPVVRRVAARNANKRGSLAAPPSRDLALFFFC